MRCHGHHFSGWVQIATPSKRPLRRLYRASWEIGGVMTNRFAVALSSLPRPGGNGYHPRLLGVANIGIRSGLPPAEVGAALRAHTPPGGRRVPDREIADAVNKAVRGQRGGPRRGTGPRWRPPRPTARPFDAAAFMAARLAEGDGCGEADIWEARHRRAMRMFPELRQLFILKTARAAMRQGDGVVDGVGKKGGEGGGDGAPPFFVGNGAGRPAPVWVRAILRTSCPGGGCRPGPGCGRPP